MYNYVNNMNLVGDEDMKVGIFIDGVTVFKGLNGQKFDFNHFRNWLQGDDEQGYAAYFNCMHNDEQKQKFFNHINGSGYQLFVRPPLYNKYQEKYVSHGVDVELAIEVIVNINKFDKFIIVSGKHDFLPLCEKMTLFGKEVEVVGFRNSINSVFSKYKQRYIDDCLQKQQEMVEQ